jgi:crotonobetainyl-CoA:carnitine CoA-transferase CaiB-like acyl-CoA transferase
VLDLTRILAGPWATQTLADLGAEVIKIERPGTGDDTRSWGPPNLHDNAGVDCGSAYFNAANRGKKSVAVDISTSAGREIVRGLAAKSDVVIENFKVGGLARYGLDYESLRAIKPDIVYCSITGFGQTGPSASRAGYDFLIQAVGGLMSLTGHPQEAPGGEPMKVGVALTDVLTGLYAAIGILAALRHRDSTGEGQYLDIALLDVQVASLANQALNFLASGVAPSRLGNEHPNIVPYQSFKTSDGHIILTVGNDRQFARFCAVAGKPDLANSPQFATNPKRVENRERLVPILKEIIAQRPSSEWITELTAAGVPAGPINDLSRVFEDTQVLARQMCTEPVTSSGTRVKGVGSPLKLSVTPTIAPRAAPLLGADTIAVLTNVLGFDPEKVERISRTLGPTVSKSDANQGEG